MTEKKAEHTSTTEPDFNSIKQIVEQPEYAPIVTPVLYTRGQIFDATGKKVCNVPQGYNHNKLAGEILTAVNHHDKLVEALTEMTQDRERDYGFEDPTAKTYRELLNSIENGKNNNT